MSAAACVSHRAVAVAGCVTRDAAWHGPSRHAPHLHAILLQHAGRTDACHAGANDAHSWRSCGAWGARGGAATAAAATCTSTHTHASGWNRSCQSRGCRPAASRPAVRGLLSSGCQLHSRWAAAAVSRSTNVASEGESAMMHCGWQWRWRCARVAARRLLTGVPGGTPPRLTAAGSESAADLRPAAGPQQGLRPAAGPGGDLCPSDAALSATALPHLAPRQATEAATGPASRRVQHKCSSRQAAAPTTARTVIGPHERIAVALQFR